MCVCVCERQRGWWGRGDVGIKCERRERPNWSEDGVKKILEGERDRITLMLRC